MPLGTSPYPPKEKCSEVPFIHEGVMEHDSAFYSQSLANAEDNQALEGENSSTSQLSLVPNPSLLLSRQKQGNIEEEVREEEKFSAVNQEKEQEQEEIESVPLADPVEYLDHPSLRSSRSPPPPVFCRVISGHYSDDSDGPDVLEFTHEIPSPSEIPHSYWDTPVVPPGGYAIPSSSNSWGYVCQRPTPLNHPNKKITDALEIIEKEREMRPEGMHGNISGLVYRRTSAAIKTLPYQMHSVSELTCLPRVLINKKAIPVVSEILSKGESKIVKSILDSVEFQAMDRLMSIWGVGKNLARHWFQKGYLCIEDVPPSEYEGNDRLVKSIASREDLQIKMKRPEVEKIVGLVQKILKGIDQNASLLLCGGFRRGKEESKDVDLVVTSSSSGSCDTLLLRLLSALREKGYIYYEQTISGNNTPLNLNRAHTPPKTKDARSTNMDFLDKSFLIFNSPFTRLRHRMDIVVAPPEQYAFAVLGWTGSRYFNRSMRLYAIREKNMTLSSHGLASKVLPSNDPSGLHLFRAITEEEIFTLLGLSYLPPHLRNA